MAILVDTSILGRIATPTALLHSVAMNAVGELRLRGEILHLTPQNLIEFRSMATRPKAVNGLGLDSADVDARSAAFEASFPLLPDVPDIFPTWKSLVSTFGVVGKQVHDARLVAVCHAHGVAQLLTFNVSDFARFATFGPGLVVIDPASI